MTYPNNLKYSKTHEWVQTLDSGNVRIGLSDYAQDSLGDLVFLNLPEAGDTTEAGGVMGDVESVKAVSDVNCPVAGTVAAVNAELLSAPEKVNEAPYEAWLVELSDPGETVELLEAAAYEEFCNNEAE